MWLSAAVLLTLNSGLDSWLYLKSLFWATMKHQVLRIQQLVHNTNH